MNYVYPIKDREQIEKMKAALMQQNYRNYVIFCLAINYGRRITDILTMKVSDVRDQEHLTIKEDKTGKKIPLKINSETKEMLDLYCAGKNNDEWLFQSRKVSKNYEPDSKGKTPLDRVQVWRDLQTAAEACGIQNIGTHSLRKTFGYHLYKQTRDIALVQRIFGHRSALDTLRYIGMEQERIDEATMALVL